MIPISEASAIALHSAVYISIKEFASLKDIAERFDVSAQSFVRKFFRHL
ncbi:hypothetical protein OGZ02_13740 [Brachyspira hyodysenteriae]|nr:hypothetical protein [Brachyspira hyodysenteriae]MDA1469862.1 hypothetical protein [Brachyspira hyodysenteriae]